MMVTFAPILTSLNIFTLFQIEVNSSNFAIKEVLPQASKKNGKWHLMAFFSKFFSPVEHNNKIYNKKILTIIQVLEK